VHPTAKIGEGARIGPFVTVAAGASVGARTALFEGARLYGDARVGDDCVIHANVVIRERCSVGNRVILASGVAIGTDGFGYRPSPDGRGIAKIPHIGTVVIEDDVEIGANSCVDRGKFGATLIDAGERARALTFGVKADLVESLGADKYVYFSISGAEARSEQLAELASESVIGENRFVARVSADSNAATGQTVELALDTTKLHVFDADTGVNLSALAR
jgi:carbonic anhydrase/acetyltransferase-like protein (isoleucine patch superfamily)